VAAKKSRRLSFIAIALGIATPALAGPPRSGLTDAIPLHYQESLIELGFPSPLLRATLSGQQVWFIIDTGAGVHVFASWFVSAARLEPRQTPGTVTGSTGESENHLAMVESTVLRLEGDRELKLREAVILELPKIFAEQRIAGLLSPQLLAGPHSAAVLDLRVPKLRFEPFDTAVDAFKREHRVISTGSRACRNPESPFENRQYAASIRVNDIDGTMLVDSGATGTVAFPNSRATINLTIGGAAPGCGSDGLLGMDALRQCVLVLGDTFAWFCDAPSR
jgi:hypothetical protein